MKRLLVAAFAAAVVLMIWGFLYWTVNPWSRQVLRGIEGEDAVIETLRNAIPETGVYFMPSEGMTSETSHESFVEKHERGPIIRLMFRSQGADPMAPSVFILGFIHFFLSAFVMAMIVMKVQPLLPGFRKRLDFIVLIALFAVLFIDWSDPVWMYTPTSYAWFLTVYHVVGWLLAGSVIAAIVRPAK